MAVKPKLVTAVACLALALPAACSSSSHKPAPSLTPLPSAAAEELFTSTLASDFPTTSTRSILILGRGACKVFRKDDATWTLVVGSYVDNGIPAAAAGALVETAVTAFCPDQMQKLPGGKRFR